MVDDKPSVGDQIESGLQEKATQTSKPNRPIDAEVEAKVDAWIEKFPEQYREVLDMGLEWLARREVHRKVKRAEAIGREAEQIFQILDADEALSKRVEDKIRNLPEHRKERARFYVAKDLLALDAMNEGLRARAQST